MLTAVGVMLAVACGGSEEATPPIVIESWYADELAQAGAIVATIDQFVPDTDEEDYAVRYLSDHGAHIRAKAEAEACAVQFVRARAAEWGNDDPVVVLTGFSEGGGLAAHVALFGESLEEHWDEFAAEVGSPPPQVECMATDGSTHVDALVAAAGTYDIYVPVIEGLYGRTWMQEHDPELQQFLASAVGINPDLTVRLFYGVNDPAIPITVSTDFEAALADDGYDVQLTTYEGRHSPPPADIGLGLYKEQNGL
jgi:dienelactone hydrolase